MATQAGNRLHPQPELQLQDMNSAVFEWCGDWYDANYYDDNANADNPKGPDTGKIRALRGGCVSLFSPRYLASHRYYSSPETNNGERGFRVVSGL